MRFAGSIYDSLRQPGVFQALEHYVGQDRIQMKRLVLARLRLDDLLSIDSEYSDARVVASLSDVLDGRLFTLFDDPRELKGVELEILCPASIADDRKSAVRRTIRGWIHKEDGSGLPAFFMAAPKGFTRTDIADVLEAREGLNVKTLTDARRAVEEAGLSSDHAEELWEHWYKWDLAITQGDFTLTRFPGAPASAFPVLRSFLEQHERAMLKYGIGEAGTEVFRGALQCLEESGGKRDRPVRFIEKQLAGAQGSVADEVRKVKGIFSHYMFDAIARGNNANSEHSASLGPGDDCASPTPFLDELHSDEADSERIALDERVVAGLGELESSQYKEVKRSVAPKIARGIEEFKGTRDLTKLSDAFGELVALVRTGHYVVSEAFDDAFRRFVWSPFAVTGEAIGAAAGAVAGGALQVVLDPSASTTGPVEGIAAGAVAGQASAKLALGRITDRAGRASIDWSSRMLKKSLVRVTEKELTRRTSAG